MKKQGKYGNDRKAWKMATKRENWRDTLNMLRDELIKKPVEDRREITPGDNPITIVLDWSNIRSSLYIHSAICGAAGAVVGLVVIYFMAKAVSA